VLDSQSDDGSWELLQEKFGMDERVKLVQNNRGLGPTHSWIDGVDCATGDYMTFVWSDDYISPRFLKRLLPMMNAETHVAMGAAIGRDVDDETPFPIDDSAETVPSLAYLAGFFPAYAGTTPNYVSPVCALFTRESFEQWKNIAKSWGRSTPLREHVMWKRAIGPDLLLYFIGALNGKKIAYTREAVAQFSAHPGSISISVSKYLLRSGYWLARCWLVTDSELKDTKSDPRLLHMSAETIAIGWNLKGKFPANAIKLEKAEIRRLITQETIAIWKNIRKHYSLPTCLMALGRAQLRRGLPRRYRKLST
jgi:glycosyltransferase involved in cell wall biosynthesis